MLVRLGGRAPVHASGAGKALLAVLALFLWRTWSADDPPRPVAGTVTEVPAAREMYLLAQNRMARRSSDAFDEAIDYLEEAVTLDPGYALAWVALAEVLLDRQAYFDAARDASVAEARSAVDRALEVNGELGQAHAVLGRIYAQEGRFDEAEQLYTQALELAESQDDPGSRLLISLNNLPRRLSLDFRDVFNRGFGYDKIAGSFDVVDGVASTCDMSLEGPSDDVR